MSRQFLILILFALPAALLASCTPMTTVPIGIIDFNQPGAKRQQTLLVFLPGIRHKAEVFADKGVRKVSGLNGACLSWSCMISLPIFWKA